MASISPKRGEKAGSPGEFPQGHRGNARSFARLTRREVAMKLVKRFAIAAGSLLALVLAGGAHVRF